MPLQLYMGERPWAGLRPVQIILKKSQGKARLTWPDGAPAQYRALSERCQTTDYKQRPTFAEVRSVRLFPHLRPSSHQSPHSFVGGHATLCVYASLHRGG